jgi:cell division protein ZapA (FtsZ GTPase activity inhibitor)
MTYDIEQLEFCLNCTQEIKQALNRIAEKLEGGGE